MRLLNIFALWPLLLLPEHLSGQERNQPAFDPGIVNNARAEEIVGQRSQGSAVLRAQIGLHRAHFSGGEIDGSYGKNFQKALVAFQRFHGLPATGTIGPETWKLLNRDAGPMLVGYVITYQDVAGPFEKVPKDMVAKAKLHFLGYSSVLEALGEKFRSSPELLQALNPNKEFDRPGVRVLVPNVQIPVPGKAASVVVSKSDTSVIALDQFGKTLAFYPASTGSTHDPLPIGAWKIVLVEWYPKYYYNPKLFWDARPSHAEAVIAPGPNNPVGVVWIELSKEHYGIHGTPEPARIGYGNSHGCIDLANWDAAELAQMVVAGTPARLTN